MPIYRFDVRIPGVSGLPEDTMVNTWHFKNTNIGPTPTDFDNVRDMLQDFYTVVPNDETQRITSWMTTQSVGPVWGIVAYDLDHPLPRAPVYTSTIDATATLATTTPLPTEVALVISISAEPQSGVPQARRRNRKYLGPFTSAATSTGARPTETLVQVIAAAARDLQNAAAAAASWDWQVYSQTLKEGYGVVGGWVDNAWDTQRRRGIAASERLLWSSDEPSS